MDYVKKATLFISVVLCCLKFAHSQSNPLELWYEKPASGWNEALPVGNGRLGAMVFGGVEEERIQLNEESVWAGSNININNPEALSHLDEIRRLVFIDSIRKAYELSSKYLLATPPDFRSYQTLGDLYISIGKQGPYKNYRRSLDISKGLSVTSFEIDGVTYIREVFASAPANSILVRIKTNKPGAINCKVTLARAKDAAINVEGNNRIIMNGQLLDVTDKINGRGGAGMKFSSIAVVKPAGGKSIAVSNSILVEGADMVTILITAATDYHFPSLNFDRSIDPFTESDKILENLSERTFEEMFAKHLEEYSSMFNRVSFRLDGNDRSNIPTDKRLEEFKKGQEDPRLLALYFQFGRYLLMGSSRFPARLPANLQGVWNDHYNAPWASDYHTNINIQMNYWPAEVCNLSETTGPLVNFINYYRIPGRVTAKEMYGAKGWTMHHATDIFGKTGINSGIHWGTSPLSAAWLCQHLWEHYLFTGDEVFLRDTAYPIMKESAEFVQNFLVRSPEGMLVTNPSVSPENSFKLPDGSHAQLTYGPAMDIMLIRTLYDAVIRSAGILKTDKQLVKELKETVKDLPPIQVSKRYGIVQEWIKDYEEAEPGHRHISQLYGLHPSNLITSETPELLEAARKTLERRLSHGGGHTGWSRAWIINFYARLSDGAKAYENLVALLSKSTLKNLFDDHPPFQIDGNFGGTAAIAEMLLQSHEEYITLLPALPEAWKSGSMHGLVARGAFTVDLDWTNGKLSSVRFYSRKGNPLLINYNGKKVKLKTRPGQSYISGKDFQL